MSYVCKPPEHFRNVDNVYQRVVFLGGSIELGAAEDWQVRVTEAISELPVMILNPRRDDWDWKTPMDPIPGSLFHEQVMWEMDAQSAADTLVYYFCANTKSPITLLELGNHIDHTYGSIHVFCPKEFWRYGNVKILCDYYGVTCHTNEAEFLKCLITDLTNK